MDQSIGRGTAEKGELRVINGKGCNQRPSVFKPPPLSFQGVPGKDGEAGAQGPPGPSVSMHFVAVIFHTCCTFGSYFTWIPIVP